MEHLGVVDEEELDHVCSERETALDRPLHQWEREIIHHHFGFGLFFIVPGWFFMVFLQNVPAPNCILA